MHAMHLSRIALTVVSFCSIVTPATPQEPSVVGVWQAREGTPSGLGPGVSASDVQTLSFDVQGRYRREIVVEGGAGGGVYPLRGKGGTIIDAGVYSFSPPDQIQYQRESYVICSVGCAPYPPPGPNAGALPFRFIGRDRAQFIGLIWTKVQ